MTTHGPDDPKVGTPFCSECYDYLGHVVWQWWAPELWRRFTIALRRRVATHLGVTESQARQLVRVQYVKVSEYQKRGLIHFHALIRLDGPPTDIERFPPPRVDLDVETLAELVRAAGDGVWFDAAAVDQQDVARRLRFGAQLDARPITTTIDIDDGDGNGGGLSEEAVAGYIAKYTTKATEDLDPNEPGARRSPHIRRLAATVEELHARAIADQGWTSPYGLLTKWSRALGYRGHCSSKSRSYSTTMGALRRARRDHSRRAALGRGDRIAVVEGGYDVDQDEAAATIVIGSWQYAGMGWLTDGDAALAAMAADAARDYAQERARTRNQQRVDVSGASFR